MASVAEQVVTTLRKVRPGGMIVGSNLPAKGGVFTILCGRKVTATTLRKLEDGFHQIESMDESKALTGSGLVFLAGAAIDAGLKTWVSSNGQHSIVVHHPANRLFIKLTTAPPQQLTACPNGDWSVTSHE